MALTNTQYDELMRSYDEKQLRHQRLLSKRRKKLYEDVPRIREIDAQIAHLSVSRGKQLLNGDDSALSDLAGQISILSGQKKKLMEESGFPSDYLNPPYECPDCQDTGYVNGQRCHCFKQAAIDLIYTQSNLKDSLKNESFRQFSLKYYSPDDIDPDTGLSAREDARNAAQQCYDFTRNFDTSFTNILLFGDTGLGKTFLSHCVARELLNRGHSVIYFSAHQLFDILTKHTFRRNDRHASSYDNIFSCDLLIIDDLGTESPNSMTVSQLFICLNERINRRKPTLISTNLSLNEIASIYSERISSRISNHFLLLHLYGHDIRVSRRLKKP